MRRGLLVAVLGAVAVVLVCVTQAFAVTGFEYKLHFTGEGKETISTISEILEQETRQQNASWTFLPKDVNVWIPKINPGEGAAIAEQEVQTADERIAQGPYMPIGKIEEHGTYFEEHDGTPVAEPFSCAGNVIYTGPVVHRVSVSPLSGAVDIDTDFEGVLSTLHEGFPSNAVGEPCYKAGKGEEGWGYFSYAWGEPTGQRIQVGYSIEPLQIGQPSIGGPAKDLNNVAISKTSEDCLGSNGCEVTFKLSGEYSLEKICEGSNAGGAFSCASSSGSSPPNTNKSSGSQGGGGKQAEEEAKKKEEAAKAAAAKKKQEEEAAKKQSEEESHASVKIESVKVTAAGLQIKIKTSEPGTVTVTGAGLKKTAKTLPAGTHTLKVAVSKKARAKHQKTKLTVSLKVGKKTVTTSKKLTL